jgi:hypothetical protein
MYNVHQAAAELTSPPGMLSATVPDMTDPTKQPKTNISLNTHDLLRQALPERANADEWDIRYAKQLDAGLAQKFAALHKATGQRGLVKCGWPGTIVKEYLWPRIVHALHLPAAPAQLVAIPDALLLREFGGRARARTGFEDDGRTTCTPIGTLIHWIALAENAPWLWEATTDELSARGITSAVVVQLQTLALWAGGLEPGEFMLAGKTPFVIDMQDALFIDSFGSPMDPLDEAKYAESITGFRRLVAGRKWTVRDRRQAVATLRSLQELSAVRIDWITKDAWRAVIEASLPKGMWKMEPPTELQAELRAAFRSHLVRLTQDWAEQVAAEVLLITEAQK